MIDKALATEMMAFVVATIGYDLPDALPEITIEPKLEVAARIQWSMFGPASITLKHWREGNPADQGHLVHELAHYVQHWNGVVMLASVCSSLDPLEIEAVTAQCRWLQSKGENPKDHLSEKSVFKMTGDAEFSTLAWAA